jgi:uncharacterized membrane protein
MNPTQNSTAPQRISLSARSIVAESYQLFKQDIGQMLAFTLFFGMAYILSALFNPGGALAFFAWFLSMALVPLSAGYFFVFRAIQQQQPYTFSAFFSGYSKALRLIGVFLFQLIIVILPLQLVLKLMYGEYFEQISQDPSLLEKLINQGALDPTKLSMGYLLMLVHGLVFGIAFFLANYFAAMGNGSAWNAMETSRKWAFKNFYLFFRLMFLLIFLNVAGFFALGVGLLFTLPMTFGAVYVLGSKITKLSEGESATSNTEE